MGIVAAQTWTYFYREDNGVLTNITVSPCSCYLLKGVNFLTLGHHPEVKARKFSRQTFCTYITLNVLASLLLPRMVWTLPQRSI